MPLNRLDIVDFRNLAKVSIEPIICGFNLITGLNGSGKTSLLEAIYYLSLGRSFRNTKTNRIIRHSTDKTQLFAHKLDSAEQLIPIGVERILSGDLKMRIAGADVLSTAKLAELLPVQLINSNCYSLLDSGPIFRRKYLDWGIFYLQKDFLRVWREYNEVLKQRNALLRQFHSKSDIETWNHEFVAKALAFDEFRGNYCSQLMQELTPILRVLLDLSNLEVEYDPGWNKSCQLDEILQRSYERDLQLGYTQYGPHRADFKIKINKVSPKDILSRGQQKLFVCAMILAQGALLSKCTNKKPIYLIDDLAAELDIVSRTKLINLLSQQETQIYITAVENEALFPILSSFPVKLFHVEQGNVMLMKNEFNLE